MIVGRPFGTRRRSFSFEPPPPSRKAATASTSAPRLALPRIPSPGVALVMRAVTATDRRPSWRGPSRTWCGDRRSCWPATSIGVLDWRTEASPRIRTCGLSPRTSTVCWRPIACSPDSCSSPEAIPIPLMPTSPSQRSPAEPTNFRRLSQLPRSCPLRPSPMFRRGPCSRSGHPPMPSLCTGTTTRLPGGEALCPPSLPSVSAPPAAITFITIIGKETSLRLSHYHLTPAIIKSPSFVLIPGHWGHRGRRPSSPRLIRFPPQRPTNPAAPETSLAVNQATFSSMLLLTIPLSERKSISPTPGTAAGISSRPLIMRGRLLCLSLLPAGTTGWTAWARSCRSWLGNWMLWIRSPRSSFLDRLTAENIYSFSFFLCDATKIILLLCGILNHREM